MLKRILACVIAIVCLVGCANGQNQETRNIADKMRRIRLEIESLKAEYETALNSIANDKELLKKKEDSIKEKMQQLERMLGINVPQPVVPQPVAPQPVVPQPVVPQPVVPQPVVPPGPIFPNSKFNLSAEVYRWAMDKVVSAKRAEEARIFADAATDMAEQIKPGDPQRRSAVSGLTRYDLGMSVKNLLAKRNKSIPPDVIATWSNVEKELNLKINTFFDSGKLTNIDDWATLFREIAAGLREVRS